jgi:hypothetical protein
MFISFRRGKVTVAGKIRFGYGEGHNAEKEKPRHKDGVLET